MAQPGGRTYTPEERERILREFDWEVTDRLDTWRRYIANTLDDFASKAEGQLSAVAPAVRQLTMGALADSYGGDVPRALRGTHKNFLVRTADVAVTESPGKRKYRDEVDGAGMPAESSHAAKIARTIMATPKKKLGFPTMATPRNRVPSTTTKSPPRTARKHILTQSMHPPASPSPFKAAKRAIARPASPVKPPWGGGGTKRPPSSATFDPMLPANLPKMRMPRKGETLLSVNGSPIFNPINSPPQTKPQTNHHPPVPAPVFGQAHQRTASQSTGASGPPKFAHGRTVSRDQVPALVPSRSSHAASSSMGSTSTATDGSRPVTPATPPPLAGGAPTAGTAKTAILSIPLPSGAVVEIDPTRLSSLNVPEYLNGLDLMPDERAQITNVVTSFRSAAASWLI